MKHEDKPSDGELLQSMSSGDEEALATLYRRRHGAVFRFALQMSGSRPLAEDITQEVFMVLIRGSHKFDPMRGSLNAFLLGIARNHLLRRLQREQLYVTVDGTSNKEAFAERLLTTEGPLDDLSRSETIDAVRKAVLSLPGRYREVIVLCDLQETSYVEAAEILGCAIGTVRSRLHRARALLIEKLRPANEENVGAVKSARCFA